VIKYILTFFMLTAVLTVSAQQKSVINLIKSSSVQGAKVNGVDVLKVYDATFQQDNSTLQSDSAYFHQRENTFDAFGHVLITQGDTMHIYSDKLNYNGNTKIAILTDNVRMIDKDATLTTNYLTYNTATKYGTYTGGGKLVNKDNVLTSKNGYYFAQTRDSYFRYDVRLVTPDALTLTDTMKYNSGSKIAYFYGPTNIYGKKKGKDNDTLYTENGSYDTNTEQAFFGKKNLYKQGTKTLTGDSLFYDRKKGFGKAINHIIFNDTEQKMQLRGDLANYYKAEERTVVTKNAYAVIVTEQKDTSKTDSLTNKRAATPDDDKKAITDSVKKDKQKISAPPNTMPVNVAPKSKVDDKTISIKNSKQVKGDTSAVRSNKKGKPLTLSKLPVDTSIRKKDTTRMKHDSIYMTADTLETRVVTWKDLKIIQEKERLSHIKDTTAKKDTTSNKPASIVYKVPVKHIDLSPPRMIPDSSYLHRHYFDNYKFDTVKRENIPITGKKKQKRDKNKPATDNTEPKKVASAKDAPDKGASDTGAPGKTPPPVAEKKLSKRDSLKKARIDSVYLVRPVKLDDTARVRILSAFHHVKMFKSDLQGKSDSAFYASSDSTIRLYINPIVWTQGSQLSADTINLQMRDKKLNNMELYPNAFVVNIEKGDSVHYNQMAGKKMRGFFKDDKLESLYVSGNAETIYFSRDSGKVANMQRSLSSRIRVNFKDSKVTTLLFMDKPEHRYGPLEKFSEEDKLLKGFIWKPKERPVSKESIIPSLNKNATVKNDKTKPGAKTRAGTKASPSKKPPGKDQVPVKAGKDTGSVKPGALPVIKQLKDSLQKQLPDTIKRSNDTSATRRKDTSAVRKPATKTNQ